MVIREMRGNDDSYLTDLSDRSLLMEPSSKPFPFCSPPTLIPSSSPPLPPSSPPLASSNGYIEHFVSKFDTLVGVAIKYGVEVADIKKMNGLVTDRQMFGLKKLHIPLPGRHPPSPILLHGSEIQGPNNQDNSSVKNSSTLFDSFQSLKLKSASEKRYSKNMCTLLQENQPTSQQTHLNRNTDVYSNPPLSHHRKCRSLAYDLWLVNSNLSNGFQDEIPESEIWIESLVRRRQKSEADFDNVTPEKLIKDETVGAASFSATAGKGVALRTKSANKSTEVAEEGWPCNISLGFWDSFMAASTNGVRKSLSTPSFQDPYTNGSNTSSSSNNAYSSLWPVASKWSILKPDLQALSNVALARPILDGLANNPLTGRRNKTAVD